MADNTTTPIADGTAIATDEIGGAHYQRVKVTFGVEGSAVDVSATNPLPVAVSFPTTQAVSLASAPLPTGAATAAKQDAIVAAIGGATYYPATQPISGNVGITGSVAVTGTFFQATQPISATALPLPAGAATETTLSTLAGKLPTLGTKVSSGSVSMAPASDATFPVSAAALPLPAGAATSAKIDELIAALNEQRGGDKFAAITPANADLTTIPDAVYVGGAGNLVVRGSDNVDATFAVTAGAILPIRPKQVRTTSTATLIVGINN